MTATNQCDAEGSKIEHGRSSTIRFDGSWKRPLINSNVEDEFKISRTTFQMQISDDVLEVTPQVNCVSGRSNGKNLASVARRNARERRRIKNVNSAFDELRQHVPQDDNNRKKKISKVDTLQSAIEYIKALEELVRSRGTATEQIDDNDDDKENRFDVDLINRSDDMMSSDVLSSDSEEKDKSNTDVLTNGERMQSDMADSMKRAFDIMLSSTTSKQHAFSDVVDDVRAKKLCVNDADYVLVRKSLKNADELVSVFQPTVSNDSDCSSEIFPITPSSDEEIFDPFQFNKEQQIDLIDVADQVNTPSKDTSTSPFPLQNFNCCFDIFSHCYSPANAHCSNFTVEHEENVFLPCEQAQLSVTPAVANQSPVCTNDPVQNATRFGVDPSQWSYHPVDAISKGDSWSQDASFTPGSFCDDQSGSDLSELSTTSAPVAIDQINPSITFLPDKDDYIQASFQVPLAADQGFNSTSLISQSTDQSWILARLN